MKTNKTIQSHVLCLGYGYTAQVLAERCLQDGWRVTGTTRSDAKVTSIQAQRLKVTIWNGQSLLPGDALDGVTHLLQSIPPDDAGDRAMQHYSEQLANVSSLVWVGYLSTTGVYGNADGDWVDEQTSLAPTNKWGEQRVIAENQWLDWGLKTSKSVQIFRLSGIYGKDRNALRKVKDGTARRLKIENQYFSRIHVADIANAIFASIQHPDAGAIYNICDDLPAAAADVTTYAADLLGIEPPPWQTLDEANLSQMAQSFYQNSKRVCNHKMKQALQVNLDFPNYKMGLKHLFENGDY